VDSLGETSDFKGLGVGVQTLLRMTFLPNALPTERVGP
jgi:hypothetical protein